jgi:hypothetical protein
MTPRRARGPGDVSSCLGLGGPYLAIICAGVDAAEEVVWPAGLAGLIRGGLGRR